MRLYVPKEYWLPLIGMDYPCRYPDASMREVDDHLVDKYSLARTALKRAHHELRLAWEASGRDTEERRKALDELTRLSEDMGLYDL